MQHRANRGDGGDTTERGVVTERMTHVEEVELCTDWWGDPATPPVLLITGLGASMLWWPDDFCRALADGGRFVVRYDHRDTGRSVTYPLGNPGYTGGDLVSDVVASSTPTSSSPPTSSACPQEERSPRWSHSTIRGAFSRSSSSAPHRHSQSGASFRRPPTRSDSSSPARPSIGPIPSR
jgi:hypothetical protein